jgi:hypothetical protein
VAGPIFVHPNDCYYVLNGDRALPLQVAVTDLLSAAGCLRLIRLCGTQHRRIYAEIETMPSSL